MQLSTVFASFWLFSKLFLVGAGGLGCELLKSLLLMGTCCEPGGQLTLTDFAKVQISNLSRQFLFRLEDIGKSKTATAAKVARAMNSSLNVTALNNRVCIETEEIFDDPFWESLDCVVTGLDNIQTRMYVDSKCVWFAKPLLESGTMGTKANVQVILPHLTQSYGDSQDPPDLSVAICIIKYFPHHIEHTIEWAKELFEQLFVEGPREINAFLANPETYLTKIPTEGTGTSQLARLNSIKQVLEQRSGPFDSAVTFAVMEFIDKFRDGISQLIHTFPLDHVTSDGIPFWSGPKRAPAPVTFDVNDPLHLEFVVAAANLYAANSGIPQCRDREKIKQLAAAVKYPDFRPKEVRFKVDDSDSTREGCYDDDARVSALIQEMKAEVTKLKESKPLVPAQFEKDDDSNLHVSLVHAAANIRARNYRIPETDFHKVKLFAGRIIPTAITTTSMVTGLVSAELLKLVQKRSKQEFKNSFINLALPLWVMSEPSRPVQTKSTDCDPILGQVRAKPEGFTTWEKLVVKPGDGTLGTFIDSLLKDQGVEVVIMSVGNACLYNAFLPAHKKRLKERVGKLWEDATKLKLSPKKTYLTIEVSTSDPDDGIDVLLPTIKYLLKDA